MSAATIFITSISLGTRRRLCVSLDCYPTTSHSRTKSTAAVLRAVKSSSIDCQSPAWNRLTSSWTRGQSSRMPCSSTGRERSMRRCRAQGVGSKGADLQSLSSRRVVADSNDEESLLGLLCCSAIINTIFSLATHELRSRAKTRGRGASRGRLVF